MNEAVARFIAEAEEIVRKGGVTPDTLAAVAAKLATLARSTADLVYQRDLESMHGVAASSRIIGRGSAGSVLMLARFPHETETPVHDHNSWGIVCVIRGRDRHRRWERVDDGGVEGSARLRLGDEREVAQYETVAFGGPPDDIHSQQGIGEAAWELVYFGADPDRLPRRYFDPAKGTVERRGARSRERRRAPPAMPLAGAPCAAAWFSSRRRRTFERSGSGRPSGWMRSRSVSRSTGSVHACARASSAALRARTT